MNTASISTAPTTNIYTWILQGSEIWAPSPAKTDRLGLKFDTQTEGLGTYKSYTSYTNIIWTETHSAKGPWNKNWNVYYVNK